LALRRRSAALEEEGRRRAKGQEEWGELDRELAAASLRAAGKPRELARTDMLTYADVCMYADIDELEVGPAVGVAAAPQVLSEKSGRSSERELTAAEGEASEGAAAANSRGGAYRGVAFNALQFIISAPGFWRDVAVAACSDGLWRFFKGRKLPLWAVAQGRSKHAGGMPTSSVDVQLPPAPPPALECFCMSDHHAYVASGNSGMLTYADAC
jgi:hypothetical protein